MRPPGPWEIALILVIVLIIFGIGKLPQVGEAIGKGIKSFRLGASGETDKAKTLEADETKAKLAAMEAKLQSMEGTKKN